MALTTQQNTDAYQFFIIAFGAAPGVTYMDQLNEAYNAGMTTKQIVNVYTTKPEFTNLYPNFITNAQFAEKLVNNVVGASATATAKLEAKQDVEAALNANWTRGDIVYQIFSNLAAKPADDATWGNTSTMMANKVTVARYVTEELLTNTTDLAALQALVSNVTQDPATVTAAITGSTNSNGQSFTLTTGTDNVPGTAGNDTIIGDNSGTATFNVSDVINGGAGTDTLKIYSPGAIDALAMPNVSNVENLYLYGGTLTNGATFDLSAKAAGVTSLEIDSAAAMANNDAFTIKTTATQDITLTKINGTGTAGNNSTVVIDGAKKLTVNAVGTTAGTVTADIKAVAVTALDLVSTGAGTAASKLALTNNGGATLATLNVSGAGDTTVTSTLAALKTVNASAATGKFNLDVSGRTAANTTVDFAFTGGSANDSIKLADDVLGRLTSGAQLDGGAGTDKLGISDTALTAAEFAALNAAKNFEVLGLNAAQTLDASKLTSLKSFSLDADVATTINNMATGSAFATSTDITAAIALAGATGVNDVALTLTGTTANSGVALTALTVGQTNIALASAGPGTAANVITTLNNADNSTITVTGSNDLTINNALKGTATGSKVDATAFTGKLGVTGSAMSDILIGGSGNDTIDGGTITAAAGTALAEKFTVVVSGAATDADTVAFNGTTITLADTDTTDTIGGKIAAGNFNDWTVAYDAGTDTLTFTARQTGPRADAVAGDFTVTDVGGASTFALATPTTTQQGTNVVVQSVDKLTGNGGADTFKFLSADLDTAAGVVTAEITDFKAGVDKIVGIVGGAAGSATNYVEATTTATTLAALLTAADATLAGAVTYYVGQVGSDSYLVTDADANGYTNVIKLTGVALDGISMADLVA